MVLADAPAVADLSAQLGYEATVPEIARHFSALHLDSNSGLFVAARGADVVGWLHVYGVRLLETDGYAEIGGVIVDVAVRRQGVGRKLVRCAERWATAQGYRELRLRSGLHRLDAHTFYTRIGYELTKTSYMFRKAL